VKKLILMAATLTMLLTATAPVALAQTEPVSYVGYITSISGNSVLVEEDPKIPYWAELDPTRATSTYPARPRSSG
jgi:hypothetical protein